MLVYEKPCKNCLFTKNRIVNEERKNQIIESCNKKDNYFVCHKSTMTVVGAKNVCCSTFYKKFKKTNKTLRLLTKIKAIRFTPILNNVDLNEISEN